MQKKTKIKENTKSVELEEVETKEKKLKHIVKDGIYIIIGCLLMAAGTSLLLLPNQLSSGGFTGIATITYYLFGIPVGAFILILNIPLFIIAFFKVGKGLAVKGVIGTMLLSLFIDILESFEPITDDGLLACIYGGILSGIGTAIILKANASTGGTDLLTYIIKAFKPYYRTSNLIVIIDTAIIILNVIVFKEIEIGLYSAIAIWISGKMIDAVFEGIYFTKTLYIVSEKYEEIAIEISKVLNRGSTGIYARGMYTNEEKMMLWCVASRSEAAKIRQIVESIDDRAFIVMSDAREAWGKGFREG